MKPTLSNPDPPENGVGVLWARCVGCGRLAALAAGDRCPDCAPNDSHGPNRCAAAHPDDPSGREEPRDAVRVVDRIGAEVVACVRHAAVALASVAEVRVYPATVDGAAIEVWRRAQALAPFDFADPDRVRGWS